MKDSKNEAHTDITEHKSMEKALQESEERFRTLVSNIPGIVYRYAYDKEWEMSYLNGEVDKIFGYPAYDFINGKVRRYDAIIHPDDHKTRDKVIQDSVNNNRPYDLEYRVIHKDGTIKWVHEKGKSIFSEAGKLLWLDGVIFDITESVKTEETLRKSREKFRAITENTTDITVILDRENVFKYANPSIKMIFDYSPEEIIGLTPERALHPDDLPTINNFLDRVKQKPGVTIQFNNFRVKHRARHWLYVEGMCTNMLDVPGVNGIVFNGRDITERVNTEKALRESENKFSQAFNTSPDCIIISRSSDSVIMETNESFCKLSGYLRDELIGKSTSDIDIWTKNSDKNKILRIISRAGELRNHQLQLNHKHNGWFWGAMSVSPFKLNGETCILWIIRDISSHKQAEEAIKQRSRELEELNDIVRSITSTLALNQVLQRIVEATPRFFANTHGAAIQLLDENNDLSTRAISDCISTGDPMKKFNPDEGIIGWAFQERRPINVPDVTDEPRFVPGAKPPSYRSLLTVPLISQDQILGTLSISALQVGSFSSKDEKLLKSLARYAAIAVQNARLYEQTLRDAETKTILLKEVNHRVKNNLATIIGLLYAEKRYAVAEHQLTYRSIMEDMINRIQGLSTVHDMLSASAWSPLLLNELIMKVINAHLRLLPPEKRVSMEVSNSQVRVNAKQAGSLALVFNELATNTSKYALRNRDTAYIKVLITAEENIVQCEFRDNGPGYPDKVLQQQQQNIGIYLVQTIVHKDLHGEVTLRNDNGAVTMLKFKNLIEVKSN